MRGAFWGEGIAIQRLWNKDKSSVCQAGTAAAERAKGRAVPETAETSVGGLVGHGEDF